MLVKLGILLLSFSAFADEQLVAQKFVQDKYFKGEKKLLTIKEDKYIPLKDSKIFRLQDPGTTSRGWIVWSHKDGSAGEINTEAGIPELAKSLSKPLSSVAFANLAEAKKVSYGILYYLGTSKKTVNCQDLKKNLISCDLGFLEEKSTLIFDSSSAKIILR